MRCGGCGRRVGIRDSGTLGIRGGSGWNNNCRSYFKVLGRVYHDDFSNQTMLAFERFS